MFHLNPSARFSDNSPITSADVLFSFNLLKAKGRPQQRAAFSLVKSADAPDAQTVRFDLTGANDRELPLTLAIMPVLSKAHTDAEHFEDQTLQIPVASGPYRIAEVVPGQRLVLKRNPDYWARDLPVSKGLYNFDEIRIDYYRDAAAMFEAFKAGLIDYRIEDDVDRWRSEYDFPAAKDGRVITASIPNGLPKGVSGFAFNTRRPMFADPRVREALAVDVRFRVDQRQSLRRRLQALGRVLRRQRAVVDRPSGDGAREGAARALSRRGAGRRDGRDLARAGFRRLGTRPDDRPPGDRATGERGLRG